MSNEKMVPLQGSERSAFADAAAVGPTSDNERFEVTVRVRARKSLDEFIQKNIMGESAPGRRQHLSREDLAKEYGADPVDLQKVAAYAQSNNLTVVESSEARRSIVLSGTVALFREAFGVTLRQFENSKGTYRGRTGAIMVPESLALIIEGVFGLDDRQYIEPHFRIKRNDGKFAAHVASQSFTPPQVASLYDFPTGLDGQGQCIAIVELGGGWKQSDIKAYFKSLKIPVPNIKSILIDHAHNNPTTPDGADGEVMLDIEVAASIAPKATIAVYFAPNTDQGFLDAITSAIHDTVNKPSVISISWGSAENNWTKQALTQFDQAFQAAAAAGITVCCSSGDNGPTDGETDGAQHVDFPASAPFVLGCGGTKLTSLKGKITGETVWNGGAKGGATGGGVSDAFPLPAWQGNSGVPRSVNPGSYAGRGVPDVAGDADPASGYVVRVDGQQMVIGGTSAVAPLIAGLVALINQSLNRSVGFLDPLLWGAERIAVDPGHYEG